MVQTSQIEYAASRGDLNRLREAVWEKWEYEKNVADELNAVFTEYDESETKLLLKITALGSAVSNGHRDCVEYLLKAGANPNMTTQPRGHNQLYLPIILAARFTCDMQMVQLFLDHKDTDVNRLNAQGSSPLLSALNSNIPNLHEFMEKLLSKGADPDLPNVKTGIFPLKRAIELRDMPAVHILIRYKADINFTTSREKTSPIMLAAKWKVPDALELLLKHGAALNCKDFFGNTPLMLAIKYEGYEEVKLLMEHFKKHNKDAQILDVDMENKEGETGLMMAASKGDVRSLRLLLQCGASADLQDARGRTALMNAAEKNEVQCIKELLASGASKDIEDNRGEKAVDIARYYSYGKCVQLLDENGGVNVEEDQNTKINDEITKTELCSLASKVSSTAFTQIAITFLDYSMADTDTLKAKHRDDQWSYNYDILDSWKNRTTANSKRKVKHIFTVLAYCTQGSPVKVNDYQRP